MKNDFKELERITRESQYYPATKVANPETKKKTKPETRNHEPETLLKK